MADEKSTAITKKSDRSFSELVRAGANLSPEEWDEARIAAARKSLPTRFQDLPSTIAYLARAKRSGLDPFMNELWAWEDKRGNLTFMTGRDGWLRIAKEDDDVEGLKFGLVYENDQFEIREEGSEVFVTHNWSIPRGSLLGAYCVVHMRDPEDDHAEWRQMQDYSHLMGKDNWKNHPKDMLQTRVISAAVKVKSPAGANLYSPEDFIMEEEGDRYVREQVGGETDAKADALAEELEAEVKEEQTVEAEATEDEEESEHPGKEDASPTENSDAGDGSSTASSDTDTPDPDEGAEPEPDPQTTEPCPVCTEPLASNQKGGHMGGHSRSGDVDDEIRVLLDAGYRVAQDDDGFYVMDADGTLHGRGPDNAAFPGWKPALNSMKQVGREQGDLEDPHASEETEVEDPEGIPENAPDWVRKPDADWGEPVDIEMLDEEGPVGYGVLKIIFGAGKLRHQAVTLNDDGQIMDAIGQRYVSKSKAIEEAEQAAEPEAETSEEPEEASAEEDDEAETWTDAYKACMEALEEGGEPGNMNLLYDLAQKLYPSAYDEDKGKVQLTQLAGPQLRNLASEIEDHLN